MKYEVKIYDKLDKNNIKKFTISTISTETYYFKNELLFYITNNIKNLLFSTIYICPHHRRSVKNKTGGGGQSV